MNLSNIILNLYCLFFRKIKKRDKLFLFSFLVILIPVITVLNFPPFRNTPIMMLIIVMEILFSVSFLCAYQVELQDFYVDRFVIILFVINGVFRQKILVNTVAVFVELFLFLVILFYSFKFFCEIKTIQITRIINKYTFIGFLGGIVGVLIVTINDPHYNYELLFRNNLLITLITIALLSIKELLANVVFEELLFRGYLMGALRKMKWPDYLIIIFQSLVFIVPHLFFWDRPLTLVTLFLTGIFYGWITTKSKSIIPSIIAHSVYNIFLNLLSLG